MDAKQKQEFLNELKNEFDDYIDYYDLMECIPGIEEGKVESLKKQRMKNGLCAFSHYTNRRNGVLMVSASKFRLWYSNNFRPINEKAPLK